MNELQKDIRSINKSLDNILELQKNQATKDDLKSFKDEIIKALGQLPTEDVYKEVINECFQSK